jgi:hypothetical protein
LAYFKDAQEVYDTLGKLFQDLVTDDELAPKFRQANTIVRYEYSEPDSVITVRLQSPRSSSSCRSRSRCSLATRRSSSGSAGPT